MAKSIDWIKCWPSAIVGQTSIDDLVEDERWTPMERALQAALGHYICQDDDTRQALEEAAEALHRERHGTKKKRRTK